MSHPAPNDEFPTPALHIDEQTVERNLASMQAYATSHHLRLRPHTKTHKSRFVGRRQLDHGASGLTVAKVGEAEVMADVCDDVFIAYPTLDRHRCARVAALAKKITVRVGLDSLLAVERLAHAAVDSGSVVGVLVDVDLGYRRTGVQSDEAAIELGQAIAAQRGLRLDGIMTYTGHIGGSNDQQHEAFAGVRSRMERLLERWRDAQLNAAVVSGGSTPAARHCHEAGFFTEIRPGTYVYNDMNTVRGGYCSLNDCAARVWATVISNNVPGQVVLDGGSKVFTNDRCGPAPDSGFGWLVQYPDARIVKLTEEHAQVDVSACTSVPQLGEVVAVIPNHICVCVNMQPYFYWHREDGHVERLHVDAQGLVV